MREMLSQRAVTLRVMTLISLVLVLSIGIHTIETAHDHPYHGGHQHSDEGSTTVSELSLYLHAGERKFLALPPLTQDTLPFVVLSLILIALPRVRVTVNVPRGETDYLRRSLRRGILHPKLYSPVSAHVHY